jgi:hypothetical protein
LTLDQLDYGIKVIINAYENKTTLYEEDLQKLLEDNNRKDMKLKEFAKVNENNKKLIEQLESKLEEAVEENKYLSEYVKGMKKELKALEEFKASIFDSIKSNEYKGSFKEKQSNNDDSIVYAKTLGHNKKRSIASELSSTLTEKPGIKHDYTVKSLYRDNKPKDERIVLSDKR